MSTQEYTLDPSFHCPFGWPTEPNYPIDNNNHSSPIHHKNQPLWHVWNNIFQNNLSQQDFALDPPPSFDLLAAHLNRLYLEALYLPEATIPGKTNEWLMDQFAKQVRRRTASIREEEEEGVLAEVYWSFMITEEALGRKWGTEMAKIIRSYSAPVSENYKQEEEPLVELENEEEMLHLNEPEAFATILHHLYHHSSSPPSASHKPSFIKPDSIAQQLEIWSIRETQLQIVLLLELIILANRSLDHAAQPLLHHKKQLSASPRKPSRKSTASRKQTVRERGTDSSGDAGEKEEKMVVKDLESLLEGLVDKLAMWQVISGLQNQLPTQSTNSSSFQNNSHLPVDLDQVQRFWTDVIEEHYTQHLPLLNASFRPKLFPTSIYHPSSSSSLVPRRFDATAGSQIARTPNLRKLARRARMRAGLESALQARQNMSPTMRELSGFRPPPPSKRSLSLVAVAAGAGGAAKSLAEQSLPLDPARASSRALFSRRQVTLSTKPTNAPSKYAPNPPPIASRQSLHLTGSKRKQSEPKHRAVGQLSTQLVTPRKKKPIVGLRCSDRRPHDPVEPPPPATTTVGKATAAAGDVLVPDTPQTSRRIH